jgi:hypothetical protein
MLGLPWPSALLCAYTFLFQSLPMQEQAAKRTIEIRVLLLDYKSGRPVKGREVALSWFDSAGQRSNEWTYLESKTGTDGIALFRFEHTPPPEFWVTLLRMGDWSCNSSDYFSTSDVVSKGVASRFAADTHLCKDKPFDYPSPPPGQIVIPARHLNGWLRMRRAMEE